MLVPLGINAGDLWHLHLLKLPLNSAKCVCVVVVGVDLTNLWL